MGLPTEDNESAYVDRKQFRMKKGKVLHVNVSEDQQNESHAVKEFLELASASDDKKATNLDVCKDIGESVFGEIYDVENKTEAVSLDGQLKSLPEIKKEFIEKKSPLVEEQSRFIIEKNNTPQKVNTKALRKESTTYELEKFKKNAMLIFNHESIQGYTRKRLGTEKDVEVLKDTFSNFNFEVTVKNDLNKDEIMASLEEFSSQDFTDYGCVAVVVLTHGLKSGLIRAKDEAYSELEIIDHFKVDLKPTLITKPKLLIIQACRGSESIKGVQVGTETQGKIRKDHDEKIEPYTLPVESDMLILHSSFIGKPSLRHETHGSWFIQSLCKNVKELARTLDFESILVEVKREVAIDYYHKEYNKRDLEFQINKQMPVTTSTLMRKLYLKRSMTKTIALVHRPQADTVFTESVLDNSTPNTPLPPRPCLCFLDHFEYYKKCLSIYLKDHPEDNIASAYYDIATTFEDTEKFNNSKEKILVAISKYFDTKDLRYLHRYNEKTK